jgi:hypothetical protein
MLSSPPRHRVDFNRAMKKRTADPHRARELEDLMKLRFKAVFDSIERLREQWERSIEDVHRTHTADVRVTRLVLRDHNQRIKALERRGKSPS